MFYIYYTIHVPLKINHFSTFFINFFSKLYIFLYTSVQRKEYLNLFLHDFIISIKNRNYDAKHSIKRKTAEKWCQL